MKGLLFTYISVALACQTVWAMYSVSYYSPNKNENNLVNGGLRTNTFIDSAHLADIYVRLSGLPPTLSEGNISRVAISSLYKWRHICVSYFSVFVVDLDFMLIMLEIIYADTINLPSLNMVSSPGQLPIIVEFTGNGNAIINIDRFARHHAVFDCLSFSIDIVLPVSANPVITVTSSASSDAHLPDVKSVLHELHSLGVAATGFVYEVRLT